MNTDNHFENSIFQISSSSINKGKNGDNGDCTKLRETKKPWLNSDGTLKSDDEVRELCGTSEEMWENYLSQTIDHELGRNEVILEEATDIEEKFSVQKHASALMGYLEQEKTHHKAQVIKKLILEHLSRRERQVVQLIFLEGKTQVDTSSLLGISRASVRVYLNRSIDKIRKISKSKIEVNQIENYFGVLLDKASSHISNSFVSEQKHTNKMPFPKVKE